MHEVYLTLANQIRLGYDTALTSTLLFPALRLQNQARQKLFEKRNQWAL